MRITALAGLFACAVMFGNSSQASAQSLEIINLDTSQQIAVIQPSFLEQVNLVPETVEANPQMEAKPEPQKYVVASRDTLSSIAKNHNTTWKRLFDKNVSIIHPDLIKIGDELTIPNPDEQLSERPLPEPVIVAPTVQPQPVVATPKPAPRAQAPVRAKVQAPVRSMGSSAGNTYEAGYCTWYVKNKRPSLPNNLGNANTWVARAAAQGMATGSTPQVGSVGQRGMHVVYVESVNGDGTVTISEMNHAGLYVITHRTLPASYFTYIY